MLSPTFGFDLNGEGYYPLPIPERREMRERKL